MASNYMKPLPDAPGFVYDLKRSGARSTQRDMQKVTQAVHFREYKIKVPLVDIIPRCDQASARVYIPLRAHNKAARRQGQPTLNAKRF